MTCVWRCFPACSACHCGSSPDTKVGELMSRLNNDVVGAQNAISNTIVDIASNLIKAIAILAVMLSLEWRLTVCQRADPAALYHGCPQAGYRAARYCPPDHAAERPDERPHERDAQHRWRTAGQALRACQRRGKAVPSAGGGVRDMGVRRAVAGSIFFVIIGLVGAVGTALVYGLGGYFVIKGTFTIGTIVAFGAYLGQLYGSLQGLASAPVDFSTSMVSFERVFEVIDLPKDIEEKVDATVLDNVRGDLEFENVTFNYSIDTSKLLSEVKRYGKMDDVTAVISGNQTGNGKKERRTVAATAPDRTDPASLSQARDVALESVSFHASAGQLVALVGPSGAGKTTMTYLIPRLYDPTEGVIRIDGHDLRDVTLESLSAAIGMVTQETYLFHDTIRTNLTYAKPDATQAEIEAATQAANIHQFITELPDGYDTVAGERGYRLSGGEKQRIALARVILKDPRILVLDEATSSLDSESETLIQEALKRVMAGRTSIVIAHRLSTILAADMILVMDRGKIVERGTHENLLALNGLYHQLYETQFMANGDVCK